VFLIKSNTNCVENKNKILYLFTAQFPYGVANETFLETEILYLSKAFRKVYIIPLSKSGYLRQVPTNVLVKDWVIDCSNSKTKRFFSLLKNPILVSKLIFSEIKDKGFAKTMSNLYTLFQYAAYQLPVSKQLIHNFKSVEDTSNCILYSYWFCEYPLAIIVANKRTINAPFVARAHRYDLYDEEHKVGIPFRMWKIKNTEKIFLISKHGIEYLKRKTPDNYHHKYQISYLGVEEGKPIYTNAEKKERLIVSCSRVVDFKRVDMIPDLLGKLKYNIRWVHFGDGDDFEKVKRKAELLPDNIKIEFRGNVSNTEIYNFYSNNYVDLFISSSSSEGLPVSMMEAQSFGIPIVSFPVGGVTEIVVEKETGFLLNNNFTINQNINILEEALNFEFDRKKIISYFMSNFCAKNNYENFVSIMQAIKEKSISK